MIGRSLVVAHGAGGGLGRVELLIVATLDALAAGRRGRVRAVFKQLISSQFAPDAQVHNCSGNNLSLLTAVTRAAASQPDVVFLTHINFAPLAIVVRALAPRARIILLTHGIEVWNRLRAAHRLSIGAVTEVWAPSEYTRAQLIGESKIPPKRTRVVPWGLPRSGLSATALAETRVDRPANDPDTRLLSVTRLASSERYKGVDSVIAAMSVLQSRGVSLRYVVVGDGDDIVRLRQLAERAGVGDRVEFRGAISDEQLAAEYARCDVFVLPSAKEGFGFSWIEAMAASRAVIGARSAATPEIIRDGETGLLVEYGDVSGLSFAIGALAAQPTERVRLGTAARLAVSSNFSFEHFVDRVARSLSEVPV